MFGDESQIIGENGVKGRGLGLLGVTGEDHPRAKLSNARVRRLQELADQGATPTELAKRYHISVGHACRLANRRIRG